MKLDSQSHNLSINQSVDQLVNQSINHRLIKFNAEKKRNCDYNIESISRSSNSGEKQCSRTTLLSLIHVFVKKPIYKLSSSLIVTSNPWARGVNDNSVHTCNASPSGSTLSSSQITHSLVPHSPLVSSYPTIIAVLAT